MSESFPSLSDYGTYAGSRFPHLWEGCVAAWAPCLGVTGATLYDFTRYKGDASFVSGSGLTASSGWIIDDGRYALNLANGNYATTDADGPRYDKTASLWYRNKATFTGNFQYSSFISWGNNSTGELFGVIIATDPNFGSTSLSDPGIGATQWGNAMGSGGYSDDAWHHCAITNTGTDYELYIDGILRATKSITTATAQSKVRLGVMTPDNQYPSRGAYLDDLRVYNRVLTVGEIRQLAIYRGIAYERQKRQRFFAPLTGSSYTQSLSVSQSIASVLNRQASKPVSVSQTSTTTIVKQGAKSLSVAQGATASLIRLAKKTLNATQATASSLSVSVGKALSVAQGVSASLTRQGQRVLSSAQSQAVGLTRAAFKSYSVSQTTTSALASVASYRKAIASIQSVVSDLLKRGQKPLSTTQGTSAALSTSKVFGLVLSAVQSLATTLSKRGVKPLSIAQGLTATIAKRAYKAWSIAQAIASVLNAFSTKPAPIVVDRLSFAYADTDRLNFTQSTTDEVDFVLGRGL